MKMLQLVTGMADVGDKAVCIACRRPITYAGNGTWSHIDTHMYLAGRSHAAIAAVGSIIRKLKEPTVTEPQDLDKLADELHAKAERVSQLRQEIVMLKGIGMQVQESYFNTMSGNDVMRKLGHEAYNEGKAILLLRKTKELTDLLMPMQVVNVPPQNPPREFN